MRETKKAYKFWGKKHIHKKTAIYNRFLVLQAFSNFTDVFSNETTAKYEIGIQLPSENGIIRRQSKENQRNDADEQKNRNKSRLLIRPPKKSENLQGRKN